MVHAISPLNHLLWPWLYGGIGFAMASSIIAVVFFVSNFRTAATDGKIRPWLAELICTLFIIPSAATIGACAVGVRFAMDLGIEDDYFCMPLVASATVGLAWYLKRNAIKVGDDKK